MPIELESATLRLRPLVSRDWPFYLSLESNEQIQCYINSPRTIQQIRQRFVARLPKWQKERSQWLCLVIEDKATNELVGLTGFYSNWHPYKQAELGFIIDSTYQGRGYATHSLKLVLDFAFKTCQFNKLTATVTEGNQASVRVLQKVGFLQEGNLRENFKINGKWVNDLKFGLLKNEFDRN